METIAISEFKAKCLAILERVRKTGQPIRVTRRGLPVADVLPPTPPENPEGWLGAMRGTGKIRGDIVEPTSELVDWDAD
jgi:prevent-host-death family protein